MAQVRVAGAVAEGQLLVGTLSYFVIDEVDGVDDISSFGFTAGAANKGELVISALSTICTPVIINSISATILHVAVEGSPTAARVLAAIQPVLTGSGANATATAGTFTVA
tara:strand:+ start:16152 stop:16481 length:330 start_codon:yes stop_codon:yes gene_type:complete